MEVDNLVDAVAVAGELHCLALAVVEEDDGDDWEEGEAVKYSEEVVAMAHFPPRSPSS